MFLYNSNGAGWHTGPVSLYAFAYGKKKERGLAHRALKLAHRALKLVKNGYVCTSDREGLRWAALQDLTAAPPFERIGTQGLEAWRTGPLSWHTFVCGQTIATTKHENKQKTRLLAN